MLSGKKLLILGGAFQHCKVVETAKELGIKTYVTDYLEDSPAKQIADVSLKYDVKDIDSIVEYCKKENINGVINTSLDPCQIPYQQICERLSLPCFGNKEQFFQLTNKKQFKKLCDEYNVDTILSYPVECLLKKERVKEIQFPILIKPEDSRGSRGQKICYDLESAQKALMIATKESSTGKVIIEKYMKDAQDFAVAYIVIQGKAYLIRTCDRYTGSEKEGLNTVAIAAENPSNFTNIYLKRVNSKVVSMIEGMGIKNGPVFMQGLIDGDTVRFYDPGFRFSGGEYERLFKLATGIDLIGMLIRFSLTGRMKEVSLSTNIVKLNGKRILQLDPTLKPGKISSIKGKREILKKDSVISFYDRYQIGEIVPESNDVSRRYAEIAILSESKEEELETVKFIQENLHIYDENEQELICSVFSRELL